MPADAVKSLQFLDPTDFNPSTHISLFTNLWVGGWYLLITVLHIPVVLFHILLGIKLFDNCFLFSVAD